MSPSKIQDTLELAGSNPFVIRTSDGVSFSVPHTDYIMVSPDGEQAVLFDDSSRIKLVATAHITSIEIEQTQNQKKTGG